MFSLTMFKILPVQISFSSATKNIKSEMLNLHNYVHMYILYNYHLDNLENLKFSGDHKKFTNRV